jgi:subtilisin family serine protease
MAIRAARASFVVVTALTFTSLGCGGAKERAQPDAATEPNEEVEFSSEGTRYLKREIIVQRPMAMDALAFNEAIAAVGGRTEDAGNGLEALGYVRVLLDDTTTADEAISILGQARTLKTERNYLAESSVTPNDSRFAELWGMRRISAPQAWDFSSNASGVLVAVIDTGIDAGHPDLSANLYRNSKEIAGNGIDDDGNGFVDDVSGWDFVNKDNTPNDDHGHGSHVSGTIGGVGNDGVGVAGVCWRVQIMGIKVLSASGSGSLWDAAQAITYAANQGARVVNASFGCPGCDVSYMSDAIAYLNTKNGLFVAAAGNSANNNDIAPFYPAGHRLPNVISVAALQQNDTLASFSNYGATSVHLAAPGVSILSSLPGGGYASWNGTSMAAPHVAGAAALLLGTDPTLDTAALRARVLSTADVLPGLSQRVATGALLNVKRLLNDDSVAPKTPVGAAAVPGLRNDVTFSWTANDESDLASYRIRYGTSAGITEQNVTAPTTSVRLFGLSSNVAHTFAVKAVDRAGNASAFSSEVSATPVDLTPPPQVIDLQATALLGTQTSLRLDSASGEASPYWQARFAADGNPDTEWISPARESATEEYLLLALRTPARIERIELSAGKAYPELFPEAFVIEASQDGLSWIPIAMGQGVTLGSGQSHVVRIVPTEAAFIRLVVTQAKRASSGLFYAGLAEVRVYEAAGAADTLTISFTAPGDDPGEGRAASYELRYAIAPIDEANFANAKRADTPLPSESGQLERVVLPGLTPESRYYFALRAYDESGNVSPLSSVASATTPVVPPGKIYDLRIIGASQTNATTLAWTAQGGDGAVGRAVRYDLRLYDHPLSERNFSLAARQSGVTAPGPAGTREQITLTQLESGVLYYAAIRAYDAAGSASAISNVISFIANAGLDTVAPATIEDLKVFPASAWHAAPLTVVGASPGEGGSFPPQNLVDGNLQTNWQSASAGRLDPLFIDFDLGETQPVVVLRIHPSTLGWFSAFLPEDFELQASADRITWSTLIHVEGLTGTSDDWIAFGCPATPARYVRLAVSKRGPGGSTPQGLTWLASLAEVEIGVLPAAPVFALSFVAPGDDGYRGTASSYDVRISNAWISEDNFANAAPLTVGAPGPGGSITYELLPALAYETTYYLAAIAIDDSANRSALSNIETFSTPPVAPAAVQDLRLSAASKTTLTVEWTATGDDGTRGRATRYDVRYSTSPITEANWTLASEAPVPFAPNNPGTTEILNLTTLAPSTQYFVAMKVLDDVGAASLISNVLSVETADGIAPAGVTDLRVTLTDPSQAPPLALDIVSDSGAYSATTSSSFLVDGSTSTAWLSPGRDGVTQEQLQLALLVPARLSRIRLSPAPAYEDLFPRDFDIQVRASGASPWQTVVAERGFVTSGAPEEWALGAVQASDVRLVTFAGGTWAQKQYVALSEIEVFAQTRAFDRLLLEWTAPGDDGVRGTASSYSVRVAPTPIDSEVFDRSTEIVAPQPGSAGALERMSAAGLSAETTYCFALRTRDDNNNWSDLSNTGCATTPGEPPATIVDLRVSSVRARDVTVLFTAPGADSMRGRASTYEARVSKQRITEATWDAATPVTPAPAAPNNAGTAETARFTDLLPLTAYHVAIRAVDAAGNRAAVSNNATFTTLDDVPPEMIGDLQASTVTTTTGAVSVTFTAPRDNGALGRASAYELRIGTAPLTPANFSAATRVSTNAPQAAGVREQLTISALAPEAAYYLAIRSIDESGNTSEISPSVLVRTRDEAPAAITDLRITTGGGDSSGASWLTLAFTAPGDNARSGRAAAYDLRLSTSAITAANFASATPVAIGAPNVVDTPETTTVASLLPGTRYYFAVVAIDARGNKGALSNVPSANAYDKVPPAAVANLLATTGTAPGTIRLTFAAPGDDGNTGRAQSYELRYAAAPIDAQNFAQATRVASPPTPATAGTLQTVTVSGLLPERLFYFAMLATDDSGNVSALSNVTSAATPMEAPGAVTDLAQVGVTETTITLSFTAPGDNNRSGTAARYDLRRSAAPITDANFADATAVATAAPMPAGTVERVTVNDVLPNETYYFALQSEDAAGNRSPLSNVLSTRSNDTLRPDAPAGLSATPSAAAGAIVVAFTAPGDDGQSGRAQRYELRWSLAPITDATWAAATSVSGLPMPAAAGTRQSFTVTGLPAETTIHLAMKAFDEAANASTLSTSVSAATAAVAPAAIATLAATSTRSGIRLSWTATGDDASSGTAASYDLRMSTSPLTAVSFASATRIALAPPAAAGTAERFTVTDLVESTLYYFAIKAIDDTGAASPISNVAQATSADLTAPAAPGTLVAALAQVDDTPLALLSAAASSSQGGELIPEAAIDANPASAWASAGSAFRSVESLTIELASTSTVDRLELAADPLYPHLFPRSFVVEVSADGSNYTPVIVEDDFETSDAAALLWGFPAVATRFIKITCLETNESFGRSYAVIAEARVLPARSAVSQVALTWLAPGDDANRGTASAYNVYRSRSAFTEATLASAELVTPVPTPTPAGSVQTMLVSGLAGETDYFFAVRARDEAGNTGPLSTVVSTRTRAIPPAPVADLAGVALDGQRVRLSFLAPGDDGAAGQAASYELRYTMGAMSSRTFALATLIATPPPQVAGTLETVTVDGLSPGVTYRFALRARDANGSASDISNVAIVTTVAPPDTVAPGAVTDLRATVDYRGREVTPVVAAVASSSQAGFSADQAADGAQQTFWASAAASSGKAESLRLDLGVPIVIDQLEVWPAVGFEALFPQSLVVEVSPDGLSWRSVAAPNAIDPHQAPLVVLFAATQARYVRLSTTTVVQPSNGYAYAVVAEVSVLAAPIAHGTVGYSFSAPGDDGSVGKAARYELWTGTCPLGDAHTTLALPAPPKSSGTIERFSVMLGLGEHCSAIVSYDDAGLRSAPSNVAQTVVGN